MWNFAERFKMEQTNKQNKQIYLTFAPLVVGFLSILKVNMNRTNSPHFMHGLKWRFSWHHKSLFLFSLTYFLPISSYQNQVLSQIFSLNTVLLWNTDHGCKTDCEQCVILTCKRINVYYINHNYIIFTIMVVSLTSAAQPNKHHSCG